MPADCFLKKLLAERISRDGPLPFSDFMGEALYHESKGYYSDPGRRVGRKGDFYTSVSVGPLFGEFLSDFLAGVWSALGRPDRWTVGEQGGHDAQLARDVMTALSTLHPEVAAVTDWVMVENRPAWREIQKNTLRSAGLESRMTWVENLSGLPASTGLFLSNELVDAFPVDSVSFRQGQWWERRVGWNPGEERFVWVDVAASAEMLRSVDRLGLPPMEDWVGEIRSAAERWAEELFQQIPEGVILTIDYGDTAEVLYGPTHSGGTLRAYSGHRLDPDLLSDPGGKDLTAHMDFSLLRRQGQAEGWRTRGYLDQHRFLTALAALPGGWISRQEKAGRSGTHDPSVQASLRQFRTLTHPEIMGCVFRVLVQARGRCARAPIPGLDYLRAGEAGES
jgi:SAM-dependent MidA family methyltransferase